jgi:fructan beta-fructosidase
MGNWMYATDIPTVPWKGMQSIPRELGLRKDSSGQIYLTQQPVVELESLRTRHWERPAGLVGPGDQNFSSDGIRGNALEIVADFECGDAREFGFKVRQGTKEETVIGYEVSDQKVFVDRTRSGRVDFNPSFPARNLAPLLPGQNKIRLHVFVDECSVEVFVNDGRTVMAKHRSTLWCFRKTNLPGNSDHR